MGQKLCYLVELVHYSISDDLQTRSTTQNTKPTLSIMVDLKYWYGFDFLYNGISPKHMIFGIIDQKAYANLLSDVLLS